MTDSNAPPLSWPTRREEKEPFLKAEEMTAAGIKIETNCDNSPLKDGARLVFIAMRDLNISNSNGTEKKCKQIQPRDACKAVSLLFFVFGLMHFLPWIFFANAHEYWMHKFRDVSGVDELTILQKNFTTCLTVINQVFAILSVFFSLFYAHKFTYRFKLFYTLTFISFSFLVLAVFIEIDTDTWQLGFFILVMTFVAGINFANYMFGMHNYSILAQFPSGFLRPYVNGQGVAALFSSILQIVALAIGISTKSSAWIYFSAGVLFIASTLLYASFIQTKNDYYQHQMSTYQDNKKEKMMNFGEIKAITAKMYPAALVLLGFLLTITPIHPACTSLITSMDHGNGNDWNDVYFNPVVSFLLPSMGDFIGRVFASLLPNLFSVRMMVTFSFARIFVFVPLIVLCNVPGKVYVPTIFGDTSYIIIMIVFSITNGYVVGMCSFIMPKLVKPEEMEDAFHVYTVAAELLLGTTAFIGFISVNLL